MKLVQKWRQDGLLVYLSINTGQDIHLFTLSKYKDKVIQKLKLVSEVNRIIINKPAIGTRLIEKHLF